MFEIDLKNDNSEQIHYNLPNLPVFISRNKIKTIHDITVECHWHEDIEFVLNISGKFGFVVNGEIIYLDKGEGILINSKKTHYGFSCGEIENDFICVIMHPDIISVNKYMEQTFVKPIINNNIPYIHLKKDIPWTAEIYNHIYDINKSFEQKEKSSALTIQSIFYKIWSLLYENMQLHDDLQNDLEISRLNTLKDMISFVHSRYGEKITLADIAKAGNVCQSRCCDIFKDYMHQSPIGYLTSYRIGKGLTLLEKTVAPITEIALSVGFNGTSYFAETFKKQFSCSPSEYRKRKAREL